MIITKEIDYSDGEIICRGFMAYDNELKLPVPAVMVAPDWGGRGEQACDKVMLLAKRGYVGFAIDMYGQAKLGNSKDEKRQLMTPFRQDRAALVNRMLAAFNTVARLPEVNLNKIAAIGYCFGGLCVLDLARANVDIKGVVSFHGLLSAAPEAIFHPIRSKILVLHGFDDPLVPKDDLLDFSNEMTTRKADWQLHIYGLTAHSFTDPQANDDEMGLHYNKIADCRSWQSTLQFLEEIFNS
ncbi:MAG: dienelactone hydrolase family protein [Tatlockia sp.]|nr:dienelactone hydrolase family protein [Tatlockia sp.]